MSLASVLKRVPDVGREFRDVIVYPRTYAKNWKTKPDGRIATKDTVAWSLAASFLLFSLYNLAFGSLNENLSKAAGLHQVEVSQSIASGVPSLINFGLVPSVGAFVQTPQNLPLDQPQIMFFQIGAFWFVISNVAPEIFTKKAITTLLVSIFGFVTVLCLHPPARLIGGAGTFSDMLTISLKFFAFLVFLGSLLAIGGAIIAVHLGKAHGTLFFVVWIVIVNLPLSVVLIRSFFTMFSEYYGLSKKRFFVACVGSALLSSFVSPLVLFPVIFAIAWKPRLWEALL